MHIGCEVKLVYGLVGFLLWVTAQKTKTGQPLCVFITRRVLVICAVTQHIWRRYARRHFTGNDASVKPSNVKNRRPVRFI